MNPLLLLADLRPRLHRILPGRHTAEMEPYFLFFFCGILPWTWFSSSLLESASVLIAGGNLIKKVLFPAEVLPVVTVVSNLVHFLLGLPDPPRVPARLGQARSRAPSSCPCPSPCSSSSPSASALFLSALTVHFRDLMNILGHVLHLWFFATPVLYALRRGSAEAPARCSALNPMAHVLAALPADPVLGLVPALAGPAWSRRSSPSSSSPSGRSCSSACATPWRGSVTGRRRERTRGRGPRRRQGLPPLRPPEPVQDPEERAPHGSAPLRPHGPTRRSPPSTG